MIPKPTAKKPFLSRLEILFIIVFGIGLIFWSYFRLNSKPTARFVEFKKDVSQTNVEPVLQKSPDDENKSPFIGTKTETDQSIDVTTPIVQLPKEVTKTTDVKKDPPKPISQPVPKSKSGMTTWESTCKFIDCR